MSRAFYKTRVIYNPVASTYAVETKRKWFSLWQQERLLHITTYSSDEQTRKTAIEIADRLMQDVVVHEGVK